MQNKKQYGIFKEVIRGLSDSKHRKTSGKLRFIFTIKCNSFLRGRAMLTHKSIYFLFTACLCGVFFCFSAEAKVCFLGDTDSNQGVKFDNYVELDTKSMCAPEYTTLYNECNNIGGVCPYDNQYVKCCGMEYAYQACISPLENARKADGSIDKCGNLYRCQCPEEYKISSTYAQQNSCLGGGGYCILNDGENDLIYYKNCICDRTNYPDKESCKNNQTESASCKDDQENIYKKCYCDRGVFPYASCEYGNKGKVCIDSSSQRAYYEECKSAREKCLEENFIAETLSQCPQGSRGCVSEKTGNLYYCTLGDGCPYPVTPQLYQCKFDKGRWCKDKGYDQVSDSPITEGSKCTLDGFEGTVVLCPENTDTANYYYQCKLSCINQARSAASKGNLTMITDGTYGDNNNPAFAYSENGKSDIYISSYTKSFTNITEWPKNGNNKIASINSLKSLYDKDSDKYSSCKGFSSIPITVTYDINDKIDSHILDVDFSNISLTLANKSIYNRVYNIGSHTWKNMTLKGKKDASIGGRLLVCALPKYNFCYINKSPSSYGEAGSCGLNPENMQSSNYGSKLVLTKNARLTLTGNIEFYDATSKETYEEFSTNAKPPYCNDTILQKMSPGLSFVAYGDSLVIFKDATINSDFYSSDDINKGSWDGGLGGTMLFINSEGHMGSIYSQWNIGLKDSDITFDQISIGKEFKDEKCKFGNSTSALSGKGIYLSNSTLNIAPNGKIHVQPGNIYVDSNSSLLANSNKNISVNLNQYNQVDGGINNQYTQSMGQRYYKTSVLCIDKGTYKDISGIQIVYVPKINTLPTCITSSFRYQNCGMVSNFWTTMCTNSLSACTERKYQTNDISKWVGSSCSNISRGITFNTEGECPTY